MKKAIATALLSALAAGCTIPEYDAVTLSSMDNLALCQAYSANQRVSPERSQQAMNELVSRKALSQKDIDDIQDGVIRTGMRDYVAICSWGPYKDVNRTTTRYGTSSQFVIDTFGPYIYAEDGRISAWQT